MHLHSSLYLEHTSIPARNDAYLCLQVSKIARNAFRHHYRKKKLFQKHCRGEGASFHSRLTASYLLGVYTQSPLPERRKKEEGEEGVRETNERCSVCNAHTLLGGPIRPTNRERKREREGREAPLPLLLPPHHPRPTKHYQIWRSAAPSFPPSLSSRSARRRYQTCSRYPFPSKGTRFTGEAGQAGR